MSDEYISKKNVREIILNQPSRYDMLENIKSAPSADVRPNIHGHWVDEKVGRWFTGDIFKCSECGNTLNISGVNCGRGDANFCPNCGADMREPKGEKGTE